MIIPGYSRYDISETGVVTDTVKGKVVRPRLIRLKGFYKYLHVALLDDTGKIRSCNVMRLLALTYLDKPDTPSVVRAKDGDNTNLALSNIEWVSYSESTKQAWQSGKMSHKKHRKNSVDEELINLLYDTLCEYDEPITVTELSCALDIPYSAARYGIIALRTRGKVSRTAKGVEVVK